jgi:O-antigen/teichoic acid export membrane protein
VTAKTSVLREVLRKATAHTLIYSIGGILTRTIAFLMLPFYTHFLSPSEYGIVELLDITAYLAGVAVGAGMGGAVARFYDAYDDLLEKQQVVSSALLFMLLLGVVSYTLLYFLSPYCSLLLFQTDKFSYYFRLIFATLHLGVLNEVALVHLRLKQQCVKYVLLSVSQTILGLLLNIYFIAFAKLGVSGIVYGGLLTNSAMSMVLMSQLFSEVKIRFSFLKLREMIRFGAPLIPVDLSMFVLTFADRLFLQKYATLAEVGIYAVGYKLGMAISILITSPFLQFWGAYYYKIAKEEEAAELFASIQEYFILVLLIGTLGFLMMVENIIAVLTPEEYHRATSAASIVVVGYLFLGASYVYRAGINIKKKTQYLAVASSSAAALNLFLNYLLIPSYSILGAAWATTLSFFFMMLLTYVVSQFVYPLQFKYVRLLKAGGCGLTVYLLCRMVQPTTVQIGFLVNMMMFLSFFVLLWLVKFYRIEEVMMIKRYRDCLIRAVSLASKRVRRQGMSR